MQFSVVLLCDAYMAKKDIHCTQLVDWIKFDRVFANLNFVLH